MRHASESRLRLWLAGRHRHRDHHTGLTWSSRAATRGASGKTDVASVLRIRLHTAGYHPVRVADLDTGSIETREEVDTTTKVIAGYRKSLITADSRIDSHRPIALHVRNYRVNEAQSSDNQQIMTLYSNKNDDSSRMIEEEGKAADTIRTVRLHSRASQLHLHLLVP